MFVELLDGGEKGLFSVDSLRVGIALFIGLGSHANVLCSFSLLADLQMTY